jgi:hypothetical protein
VEELGSPSHPRVQAWLGLQMMRATGSRDRQGRWLVLGCLRNARPQQFTAEEVVRGFHALIEHLLRVRRPPLSAATSSRLHIHIQLLPRDDAAG